MIERFEIILFVLLSPAFVEAFLRLSPLFLLGSETPQDERDRDHGILLQSLHDVGGFVTVNALNRLPMNHFAGTACFMREHTQ